MVEVNCIGQKCPMPLISTKKALKDYPNECLLIKVDNSTSCTNLQTYLSDMGIHFSVLEENGVFILTTENSTVSFELDELDYCSTSKCGYIVVLDKTEMGHGDVNLGHILLKGFLTALVESEKLPEEVICYNSGVRLLTFESELSPYLKRIEDKGVKIKLCGTCVDFYEIRDNLVAGEITNMYYILSKLNSQYKIIKP